MSLREYINRNLYNLLSIIVIGMFVFSIPAHSRQKFYFGYVKCDQLQCTIETKNGKRVDITVEKKYLKQLELVYRNIRKADRILQKRGFLKAARGALLGTYAPRHDNLNLRNDTAFEYYGAGLQTFLTEKGGPYVDPIPFSSPLTILAGVGHGPKDGEFDPVTGRRVSMRTATEFAKTLPSCYRKGNPFKDCRPLKYSPWTPCLLGKAARKELLKSADAWKNDMLGDLPMLPAAEQKSRIALENIKKKRLAKKARLKKTVSLRKKATKKVRKIVDVCNNYPGLIDGVTTIEVNLQNTKGLIAARSLSSLTMPQIKGFDLHNSYDVVGNNLSNAKGVKSVKDCARRCKKASGCAAFTYDKWNRWCFLKTSAAELRLEPKTVSGFRAGTTVPDRSVSKVTVKHYRGKTFPYKGYKTLKRKSFASCKSRCLKESKCVAFSFEKSGGDCRLMNTAGEYFSDAGVDSGIKRQAAN